MNITRIKSINWRIKSIKSQNNQTVFKGTFDVTRNWINCLYITLVIWMAHPFGIINLVIIGFVITSFKETKLTNLKNGLNHRKSVFQRELQLIHKNFEGLEDGKEFIIPGHQYAHDLDIFGFKSLFQILNRTSTFKGKKQLSKWLNTPLTAPHKIIQKQDAVNELAQKENWCYAFITFGKSSNDKVETQEAIDHWLNDTPLFKSSGMRWIGILLPFSQ